MSHVSSAGFGAFDVAVIATPSIYNTSRYIGKIVQYDKLLRNNVKCLIITTPALYFR
jgi:hypothetical protein